MYERVHKTRACGNRSISAPASTRYAIFAVNYAAAMHVSMSCVLCSPVVCNVIKVTWEFHSANPLTLCIRFYCNFIHKTWKTIITIGAQKSDLIFICCATTRCVYHTACCSVRFGFALFHIFLWLFFLPVSLYKGRRYQSHKTRTEINRGENVENKRWRKV